MFRGFSTSCLTLPRLQRYVERFQYFLFDVTTVTAQCWVVSVLPVWRILLSLSLSSHPVFSLHLGWSEKKNGEGRMLVHWTFHVSEYHTVFTCDVRHKKIDLKVFVVVIPKEGLPGEAPQSFFGYDTDYKILLYCLQRLYFVVGVICKEGLVGPQPTNPSLSMTMTKTLQSVFLWPASNKDRLVVRLKFVRV